MTFFIRSLNAALNTKADLSLSEVARRSGVHVSNLSEIRQGKRGVNREIVGKLLSASGVWTMNEVRQLLVGWLKDQVPDGFADQVKITAAGTREEPITAEEKALAFFREKCATSPDFAEWLVGLHRQLSGERN